MAPLTHGDRRVSYDDLRPFALPRDLVYLDAIGQYGSTRKAAKALGVAQSAVSNALARLRLRAARAGYAPDHDMTHTVPPGYSVRGVSTYYNKDGQPTGQWVKSAADDEAREAAMREAMEAFIGDIPKAKPAQSLPKATLDDLINLYVWTDYHVGMYSWHEEAGEDWDLQIAEDLVYGWFAQAIAMAPPSRVGLLAQLGDLMHFDSLEAVTPAHRNQLDADTRAQKIVRVVIRLYRRVIELLLTKHETVRVIVADANHDPMGSIWCREWLHAHYGDEPRVSVDLGADGYYAHEHGLTSLFFHHGHRRKVATVDDVFVAKYRDLFGRTKYSYGHMGHFHHIEVKETNLMVVEQHRTMAAKDAYASRGGYMAGREAKVITYSKRFGEVGRVSVTPEMVAAHE